MNELDTKANELMNYMIKIILHLLALFTSSLDVLFDDSQGGVNSTEEVIEGGLLIRTSYGHTGPAGKSCD